MWHAWFLIILTLVADGVAGLAGGLLSERWLSRHQASLIGFAAGALLGAVFLDILPEAIESFGLGAINWAFSGFIALAVIEWILGHHHRREGIGGSTALPPSLLISDGLHNIGDGAAIAAGFLISTRAGLAIALAVVAHEVPQEVGDYALLRAAQWKRSAALLALGAVQFTAALGAVGVVLAAERFDELTAIVLSIAAGTFLYIGATDLLPEVHSGRTSADRNERMVGFVSGMTVIAIISIISSV